MSVLPAAPWFNPAPRIHTVPLHEGQLCVVIDEVLREPEAWVEWAAAQAFAPPAGYPYPGRVLQAPAELQARVMDAFSQHARGPLGARRTQEATVRFSLVSTPPEALLPVQWLCHRDRVSSDPGLLFAASVLYLFRDPALGGTSFYRPLIGGSQLDQLLGESQLLDAAAFAQRWQVQPGYMAGSNAYFERTARIPAAWNRMIVYDGGLFHSADADTPPARLTADARTGRLTLNSFFTCRRAAR